MPSVVTGGIDRSVLKGEGRSESLQTKTPWNGAAVTRMENGFQRGILTPNVK